MQRSEWFRTACCSSCPHKLTSDGHSVKATPRGQAVIPAVVHACSHGIRRRGRREPPFSSRHARCVHVRQRGNCDGASETSSGGGFWTLHDSRTRRCWVLGIEAVHDSQQQLSWRVPRLSGNSNLASISFVSDSQYELTRSQPCDPMGANECFESGVFSYASNVLSLTSDDTKQTTAYDVDLTPDNAEATQELAIQDGPSSLVTGQPANLLCPHRPCRAGSHPLPARDARIRELLQGEAGSLPAAGAGSELPESQRLGHPPPGVAHGPPVGPHGAGEKTPRT